MRDAHSITRRVFASSIIVFDLVAQAGGRLGILLLGPPASGKSTQAQMLKRQFRIPSVDAAELVRKSHGSKSPITKTLKAAYASGEFLRDDELNTLLEKRLMQPDAEKGFILDGYPCTKTQLDYFSGFVKEHRLARLVVVHLMISDDEARRRMNARRRADDTPEFMDVRLKNYRQDESTVLNYFKGGEVLAVDGTKPEGDIFAQIRAHIDARK
jgi:adenylate kinase